MQQLAQGSTCMLSPAHCHHFSMNALQKPFLTFLAFSCKTCGQQSTPWSSWPSMVGNTIQLLLLLMSSCPPSTMVSRGLAASTELWEARFGCEGRMLLLLLLFGFLVFCGCFYRILTGTVCPSTPLGHSLFDFNHIQGHPMVLTLWPSTFAACLAGTFPVVSVIKELSWCAKMLWQNHVKFLSHDCAQTLWQNMWQ